MKEEYYNTIYYYAACNNIKSIPKQIVVDYHTTLNIFYVV